MTPYPIDADPALDALIEAARIMVDNGREGGACYYRLWAAPPSFQALRQHPIGSDPTCTLCQLYRALAAYEVST